MKTRVPFIVLPLIAVIALTACDKKSASKDTAPKSTDAAKVEEADWCAEHGVPESVCTRCNPKLIADFKEKGDWCKEHNLPESQCIKCDPSLKEKFEAMAPKD
jgi:hypothetical protein